MSQTNFISGKVYVPRTEVIKVASIDVDRCIKQYHLTVIGKVWNPWFQNMDSLLFNLPKFWKMEKRVTGADLGFGKFQFNFQSEEDLGEVLKNSPYHFDSWMVYVVRWEPIVDSNYPYAINFWIKVGDVPCQYWNEQSLWDVGRNLGIPREIDEDSGRVRVTFNGFNQLAFQTIIPFDNGDEVRVRLEYLKLANFCFNCHRITHQKENCHDLRRGMGSTSVVGVVTKDGLAYKDSGFVRDSKFKKGKFIGKDERKDYCYHKDGNLRNPGSKGKSSAWPKPLYKPSKEMSKPSSVAALADQALQPSSSHTVPLVVRDKEIPYGNGEEDDLFLEDGEFNIEEGDIGDLMLDEEVLGENKGLDMEGHPITSGEQWQSCDRGESEFTKSGLNSKESGYPETTS